MTVQDFVYSTKTIVHFKDFTMNGSFSYDFFEIKPLDKNLKDLTWMFQLLIIYQILCMFWYKQIVNL